MRRGGSSTGRQGGPQAWRPLLAACLSCGPSSPNTPPSALLPQVLANQVRAKVQEARGAGRPVAAADGFNSSTVRLLNRFLESKTQPPAPGAGHNFPPGLKSA